MFSPVVHRPSSEPAPSADSPLCNPQHLQYLWLCSGLTEIKLAKHKDRGILSVRYLAIAFPSSIDF